MSKRPLRAAAKRGVRRTPHPGFRAPATAWGRRRLAGPCHAACSTAAGPAPRASRAPGWARARSPVPRPRLSGHGGCMGNLATKPARCKMPSSIMTKRRVAEHAEGAPSSLKLASGVLTCGPRFTARFAFLILCSTNSSIPTAKEHLARVSANGTLAFACRAFLDRRTIVLLRDRQAYSASCTWVKPRWAFRRAPESLCSEGKRRTVSSMRGHGARSPSWLLKGT